MRSLFHKAILSLLLTGLLTACSDNDNPNYQYFPDMAYPVPYEAYGEYDVFVNGQEAKLPVEGTIPRGWKPFDYENSADGREEAKAELTNPLPYTEDNLNEGRELYTIYCAVCHGDNGDGQGILAEREKILGVPAYDDAGRAITEGSVYHVMYYGLNAMGSYAAQTSEEERWKIAHYVMSLKDQLEGNVERDFEDAEEGEEEQDDHQDGEDTLSPDDARAQDPSQENAEAEDAETEETAN